MNQWLVFTTCSNDIGWGKEGSGFQKKIRDRIFLLEWRIVRVKFSDYFPCLPPENQASFQALAAAFEVRESHNAHVTSECQLCAHVMVCREMLFLESVSINGTVHPEMLLILRVLLKLFDLNTATLVDVPIKFQSPLISAQDKGLEPTSEVPVELVGRCKTCGRLKDGKSLTALPIDSRVDD